AQRRRLPPAQTHRCLHPERGQRPAAGRGHPALPRPSPPPGAGPARVVATRPGRPPGHVPDHPRLLGPPRLGRRLPAPPRQADRGPRRPRRDRTAARPAPGAPRPAQPPPLAETSSSTHEHRTTRSQQRCRPATVMTALWLAPLDGVALTVARGVEGGRPAAVAATGAAVVLLVFLDRDDCLDVAAAQ